MELETKIYTFFVLSQTSGREADLYFRSACSLTRPEGNQAPLHKLRGFWRTSSHAFLSSSKKRLQHSRHFFQSYGGQQAAQSDLGDRGRHGGEAVMEKRSLKAGGESS